MSCLIDGIADESGARDGSEISMITGLTFKKGREVQSAKKLLRLEPVSLIAKDTWGGLYTLSEWMNVCLAINVPLDTSQVILQTTEYAEDTDDAVWIST